MDHPEVKENMLLAFREGDTEAFAFIFRSYYRPLCYFALQLIPDLAEAEDIVKDSFIKLWQKHSDFEDVHSLRSFLYVITRNACLNVIRHNKVKRAADTELAYLQQPGENELALNQLIHAELMQQIYTAIENLPDKRKEIFKLAFLEGLKNDEIARHLGISIYTVKEQKARALNYLRLHFTDKQLLLFIILCAKTWHS